MMIVILPVFWLLPNTVYFGVRAILILITRNREREILSDDVVAAEISEAQNKQINEEI